MAIGTDSATNTLKVVGDADMAGPVAIGTESSRTLFTAAGDADFQSVAIGAPVVDLGTVPTADGNASDYGNLGIGPGFPNKRVTVSDGDVSVTNGSISSSSRITLDGRAAPPRIFTSSAHPLELYAGSTRVLRLERGSGGRPNLNGCRRAG